MTKKEAVKILKYYQKWRKGAETPQPDVKEISKAIDKAIEVLRAEAENDHQSDNLIKHNRKK